MSSKPPRSDGFPPDLEVVEGGGGTEEAMSSLALLSRLYRDCESPPEMVARRFAELHPDLGYMTHGSHNPPSYGKAEWYRWTACEGGHRWMPDGGEARRRLLAVWQELQRRYRSCKDGQTAPADWFAFPSSFDPIKTHLLDFVEPLDRDHDPDGHRHKVLLSDARVLDMETLQIEDNRREYLLTDALPVRYDPSVKCERYLAAERAWCGGSEGLVRTLNFLCSLLIMRGRKWSKVGLIVGRAGTGKSAFLSVVERVFGHQYSVISEDALFYRGRSPSGKDEQSAKTAVRFTESMVVSIDELSYGVRVNDAELKRVSDPDTMRENKRLYQNTYQARSRARALIVSNFYPSLVSSDEALRDRLLVVPFNQSIRNTADNDQRFLDTLEPEIDGIFTRWVDKARTILHSEKGYREILDEWVCEEARQAADSMFEQSRTGLESFLLESVERRSGASLNLNDLLDEYNLGVQRDKDKAVMQYFKKVFSQTFQLSSGELVRTRIAGNHAHVAVGFAAKPQEGLSPPPDDGYSEADDEEIPW